MSKDIFEETNFYGIVDEILEIYSDDDIIKIKNNWFEQLGEEYINIKNNLLFNDEDFLRNFIHFIPFEEQLNYIKNTIDYEYHKQYDPNYVLVVRRAVPSYESKPENFWTTEGREVLCGLSVEIRNEQRLHSVIMVSNLKSLENHGTVSTTRGCSDGEIAINPNKVFSDFLFMYKPRGEFFKLVKYLEDGGITREDLLLQLRNTAFERAKFQGLPIDDTFYNNISGRKNTI